MNGLLLQFWQNTFHVKFYILNYILKLLKLVLKKEILWARDVAQWWSMRLSCARLWAPRPKKYRHCLKMWSSSQFFNVHANWTENVQRRKPKEHKYTQSWVSSIQTSGDCSSCYQTTYYTSFLFYFILFYFCFFEAMFHSNMNWPGTHYIAEASLELMAIP